MMTDNSRNITIAIAANRYRYVASYCVNIEQKTYSEELIGIQIHARNPENCGRSATSIFTCISCLPKLCNAFIRFHPSPCTRCHHRYLEHRYERKWWLMAMIDSRVYDPFVGLVPWLPIVKSESVLVINRYFAEA